VERKKMTTEKMILNIMQRERCNVYARKIVVSFVIQTGPDMSLRNLRAARAGMVRSP